MRYLGAVYRTIFRRPWWALALLLTACAPAPVRPNLLLVTVDTLRADRLACYGGPDGVGPGLCSVAKAGVRYRWAFATAPSTAPSIASILTSRYPSDHGVTQFANTALPDEATTLAEILREAGYATGAFVANPVLQRPRRLDQGFDHYDDHMTRPEGNRVGLEEREARELSRAALAWAREARQPWFLWLHYQDPHGPYAPPAAPPAQDAPDAERLPLLEDHSGYGGIPAYQAIGGVRSLAAYEGRYRAEIVHLDIQLARLHAELGAMGPLGVLVTADHGEAFGEDGYYLAHGQSLGLDQIRVPLLWHPPGGRPAPVVVDAPVSGIDVAPTLLAAAGIEAPPAFQGRALPQERGAAARPIFAEHRVRIAVMEGDRYYARDLPSLAPGRRDRITGGVLAPLPARSAVLGARDDHPPYEPADPADAAGEARVADHLTRARGARGTPETPADVGDRTKEQLRALGYLE